MVPFSGPPSVSDRDTSRVERVGSASQAVARPVLDQPDRADDVRPPWLRRARDGDHGGRGTTDATVRVPERFETPAQPGADRHAITYRWVRVSDGPDEGTSNEVGRIDRGDEIEVIGEHQGSLRIRTPSGLEGWIPRVVIVG